MILTYKKIVGLDTITCVVFPESILNTLDDTKKFIKKHLENNLDSENFRKRWEMFVSFLEIHCAEIKKFRLPNGKNFCYMDSVVDAYKTWLFNCASVA
tara:strand:- start:114 stop:407 length:294 start_codon:yes stop_codon:yes gene_type:complete